MQIHPYASVHPTHLSSHLRLPGGKASGRSEEGHTQTSTTAPRPLYHRVPVVAKPDGAAGVYLSPYVMFCAHALFKFHGDLDHAERGHLLEAALPGVWRRCMVWSYSIHGLALQR
jgi:hypothetical protein